MDHLVFIPWRDNNELLTVRHWLYPAKGCKDPDLRRKACNRISAWKLRGNLPHAVESTWFLTDAILSDDTKSNQLSPFAIRACYSTAFCRFVTGLLDSEQDAKYKVSMYAKAKQIGLPASFVELRHEATHGDLPSLVVFRRAAERSLDWLWNDYWRYLDVRSGNLDEDELDAFKEGREKLKENLRNILRQYNEACIDDVKTTGRRDVAMATHSTDKACLEIVRICKNGKLVIAELVKVLLEHETIIPRSRTLGHHMDEVFPLWESLLKKLTSHQPHFLIMLTDEMLVRLISPSMLDVTIDSFREAIAMWLERICTTKGWLPATKRGKLDDSVIMETCLQNPNHWTVRLAVAMIENSDHKIAKEFYAERVSKAADDWNTKPKVPLVRSISIENLDRLLPSQRKWLESEEGLAKKARYLKRTQHLREQPERSNHTGEPQYQAARPTSDGSLPQQGVQSKDMDMVIEQYPGDESDEHSEEDRDVEGWTKWKGVWIAKPIGMV